MRRLFLHIGMHKTGSSAIQVSLAGYDDGTTAYLTLRHSNHSAEMTMLFRPDVALGFVGGKWARSPADLAQKTAFARRKLDQQVTADRKNLIISGEGMSLHYDAPTVQRLKDHFAPSFDDIRVIVYLREPYGYLSSASQQVIKSRSMRLSDPPFPMYRQRLSPWEEVFGRAAMDYVLFDRASPAGRDVVSDFAARVGLPQDRVNSRRVNESMSAEAFATLYCLRNGISIPGLDWPAERVEALGRRFREFGSQKFALASTLWSPLTPEQIEEISWAEERLGCSFPGYSPAPGALLFSSEAEVLVYAARFAARARAWSRRAVPYPALVWRRLLALADATLGMDR